MISVVIPAFNEQESILATVAGVRRVLNADPVYAEAEIIVVDDGSSDGTAELAKSAGALVIRHPHNIGYGRALKTGIHAARHKIIAILDADGTYPIDSLPILVREFQGGYDMVVGVRTGEHYRESALKAPLRSVLTWLVEFTVGARVPDVNSGMRVFDRAMCLRYISHLCDTFSFTTSLTLACMMNGHFVRYLPIAYHRRQGRTKVRLFRDSLRTMQYIVQATTYFNPLKIFLLLSGFCLGLAGGSLLAALACHMFSLFLFGMGAVLLAVLVLALGLLAVLLKQIMDRHGPSPT